jgi:hypothetical protein
MDATKPAPFQRPALAPVPHRPCLYAWVITRDNVADWYKRDTNIVGLCGPRNVTPALLELARGKGTPFRLLDANPNVICEGLLYVDPAAPPEADWGPLDDMRHTRAKTIQIRDKNGEWMAI